MKFIIVFVNVILLLLPLSDSQALQDNENYLGCFSTQDGNSLTGLVFTSTSVAPSLCLKECRLKGFLYAALQGGNNCYCGEKPMTKKVDSDSECNIPCSGDSSETCGGNTTAKLYILEKDTKEVLFNNDGDVKYLGCFRERDMENRKLRGNWNQNLQMSTEECIQMCQNTGYLYAGLVKGNICYCGSGQAILSERAGDSKCNKKCFMESWKCGGNQVASVYGIRKCQKADPKYAFYVGCYKELPDVTSNYYSISNNSYYTDEFCIQECQEQGYLYASLQDIDGNGLVCRCFHDYKPDIDRLPKTSCNKPCAGDPSKKCGTDKANRVFSVGKCQPTDYHDSETSFLGCYKGSTISPSLTGHAVRKYSVPLKFCLRLCHGLGFMYAGHHSGKMCSCGNEHLPASAKAEEQECNSHGPEEFWRSGSYQHLNLYHVNNCKRDKEMLSEPFYIGCFKDYIGRTLKTLEIAKYPNLTPDYCFNKCREKKVLFAGLQGFNGDYCLCGNEEQTLEDRGRHRECNRTCSGDPTKTCGADWKNEIYALMNCQKKKFDLPVDYMQYYEEPYKPRFNYKVPKISKPKWSVPKMPYDI